MEVDGVFPKSGHMLELTHSHFGETYILGDPITRGQYSTVFRCLYKGKVERACRVYNKKNVDREKVEKYLTCITTLNHPNIAHIFDAFESDNDLQVICERLYGDELFERIVELGHYSEQVASSSIATILSALEYLHRNDIVHGDIRPESLIFQSNLPNAPLKLRDVSFSKLAPNSHAVIYMAPEYQEHTQTSKTEDVWSLGVVVYTMLCGLEPYDKSLDEANALHLHFIDDLSSEAKDFILKLLEGNPEKRLTTSEALNHIWISNDTTDAKHLDYTLKRLREFNAKRRFRVASNAVLATKIIGEKLTGIPCHRQEKDCH